MKFYIVDAFTDRIFGGNPAGVVFIPEGSDFPDPETMRKTAAELRYSETVFVKEKGNKEYDLKYFTPAAEVDLCGHATIATFNLLRSQGVVNTGDVLVYNTLAGRLNAVVTEKSVLMDMGKAETFGLIDKQDKLDELYKVMGLKTIVPKCPTCGNSLYPELVSTGLTDIMMPVESMEQLNAIAPDFPALSKLSEAYSVTGVHAFTLSAGDGAIHCRNFAPLYDIDEEAATGTSNGALTYYLYKRGIVKPGVENLFIQGEAMDRPSRISSLLTEVDGGVRIQVGGIAAILAEGQINL